AALAIYRAHGRSSEPPRECQLASVVLVHRMAASPPKHPLTWPSFRAAAGRCRRIEQLRSRDARFPLGRTRSAWEPPFLKEMLSTARQAGPETLPRQIRRLLARTPEKPSEIETRVTPQHPKNIGTPARCYDTLRVTGSSVNCHPCRTRIARPALFFV